MNDQEDKASSKGARAWWGDLRSAGMLWLILVAVVAVGGYSWFLAGFGVDFVSKLDGDSVETLGQVGDSFGALTAFFNALAFMALVATIVLQTRELGESRTQLKKQADAQREWAEAAKDQIKLAREQIALTATLEAIRIRPFLKVEWQRDPHDSATAQFTLRNVGLGVGIINEYELHAAGVSFGSVEIHGGRSADVKQQWRESLHHALRDLTPLIAIEIELRQFDESNRALAPNETLSLAVVRIPGELHHAAFATLAVRFSPLIRFRSANWDEWTTKDQFTERPGATKTATALPMEIKLEGSASASSV